MCGHRCFRSYQHPWRNSTSPILRRSRWRWISSSTFDVSTIRALPKTAVCWWFSGSICSWMTRYVWRKCRGGWTPPAAAKIWAMTVMVPMTRMTQTTPALPAAGTIPMIPMTQMSLARGFYAYFVRRWDDFCVPSQSWDDSPTSFFPEASGVFLFSLTNRPATCPTPSWSPDRAWRPFGSRWRTPPSAMRTRARDPCACRPLAFSRDPAVISSEPSRLFRWGTGLYMVLLVELTMKHMVLWGFHGGFCLGRLDP